MEKGELLGYVRRPVQGEHPGGGVAGRHGAGQTQDQAGGGEASASRVDETLPAVIEREVPAANYLLPSKALGIAGGGRIPVDPRDERGIKAIDKVFQLDIALAVNQPLDYFGERVLVRFDHGTATLAHQWFRLGRQLFMRHFGV